MENMKRIYLLLETVPFEKLRENEKEEIIKTLGSLEEFYILQKTLYKSKIALELEHSLIEPPDSLFMSLKQEFKKKNAKKKSQIFTFKIPFYQALAACIAIFIFTFILFSKGEKTIIVEKTKIIEKPIEVVKEVPVYLRSKVIYKTVNDSKNLKPQIYDIANKKNSLKIDKNKFGGLDNLSYLDNIKKGKALSEDTTLGKFIKVMSVNN